MLDNPVIIQLLAYGFCIVMLLFLLNLLLFLFKVIKRLTYRDRLSKSGMKEIDQMDGIQFEHYLKTLFNELGYKSIVTQASHVFGADLVLKKDNEKIVIQAKRYQLKNTVGMDAVQQIFAAKTYYQADESWIITTSAYSPSALKLAAACNVQVLDRNDLVSFVNKINPEIRASDILQQFHTQETPCPRCEGKLIIRVKKATQEKFLGCSNYPSCRQTAPYTSITESTS